MFLRPSFLSLLLATPVFLCAGEPSQPVQGAIGPVAFQTHAGGTFVYVSSRVTFAELPTQTPAMARRLARCLKAAGVQTFGPLLIIQKGVSQDPAQPFDQEVGVLVSKQVGTAGEAQIRPLAPFPCATTVVSGGYAGEGAQPAFQTLFRTALEQKRVPTGEIRELVLFWEDAGSPNNLMQLQVGLK